VELFNEALSFKTTLAKLIALYKLYPVDHDPVIYPLATV